MKAIDDGLAAASAMAAGTAALDAGFYANPMEIGGKVSAKARFDETWYGFVEAQGGYSFAHRQVFGEAYAGIGARW